MTLPIYRTILRSSMSPPRGCRLNCKGSCARGFRPTSPWPPARARRCNIFLIRSRTRSTKPCANDSAGVRRVKCTEWRLSVMGESRIVIIGAGGHAKVVMEIIRSGTDGVISGLTDRDPRSRWLMGAEVLGDDSILPSLFADGVRHAFVALGDNRARMVAARKALALGFDLVNAVSPHAMISPSVRMGRGVA